MYTQLIPWYISPTHYKERFAIIFWVNNMHQMCFYQGFPPSPWWIELQLFFFGESQTFDPSFDNCFLSCFVVPTTMTRKLIVCCTPHWNWINGKLTYLGLIYNGLWNVSGTTHCAPWVACPCLGKPKFPNRQQSKTGTTVCTWCAP